MNNARAPLPILAAIAALLTLPACGAGTVPAYSAPQMAEVILAAQEGLPPLAPIPEEDFAHRLENVYMLDPAAVTGGAVYIADGTEADELAVFQVAEGTAPAGVVSALTEYIASRAGDFAGYFPEEAAMIEGGKAAVRGSYVALLICDNPAGAEQTFLTCFSDSPPPLPAPASLPLRTEAATEPSENLIESRAAEAAAPAPAIRPKTGAATEPAANAAPSDEYDHSAVLAAWESGDASGLGEKSLAVYEMASDVIAELITEDMEDNEKELLLHDWIVRRTYYDSGQLSSARDADADPDSTNPYGLMIKRQAICEGYSSTFQLFMDMIGIECVTVYGTSGENEEHAWNMVRLSDGEWYCVDVTWDDTSDDPGEENLRISHAFYNATSDYLRANQHYWDEDEVPEATSETYMTW